MPEPGADQLTTPRRIAAERALGMSVIAPTSGTIRLHRLTMVTEDDGVMVGRPDICSYAVFPAEGAEALRLLDAGTPVSGSRGLVPGDLRQFTGRRRLPRGTR